MTHISKLTKADLVERIDELQAALAEAEGNALAAQQKIRDTTPKRVPEAEALAGCTRALDSIPTTTDDGYNYGIRRDAPDRQTIRRILVHLAGRYGVNLIETTTEPCSRPHLDQIDMGVVSAALNQAVMH